MTIRAKRRRKLERCLRDMRRIYYRVLRGKFSGKVIPWDEAKRRLGL